MILFTALKDGFLYRIRWPEEPRLRAVFPESTLIFFVRLGEKVVPANEVPDVHGMGARDAVYIMESRGIKVILDGRGSVLQQSIGAGEPIRRGMVCRLKLG